MTVLSRPAADLIRDTIGATVRAVRDGASSAAMSPSDGESDRYVIGWRDGNAAGWRAAATLAGLTAAETMRAELAELAELET
jgi:hypothetical protein